MACELIAVASQNNPPCQKAFLSVVKKLLELVRDVKSTEDVKIQAVRAISSRCFLAINGATLNYLIPRGRARASKLVELVSLNKVQPVLSQIWDYRPLGVIN